MRNKTFDVIRGIAIVLMVLANPAPLYSHEFPFALRMLFSFPAPMFILISGLMLALGTNKHPFSYFLKRALFIIGLAALIDMGIQGIVPFQGFDILYLIGFSMPIVILAIRLNFYVQALIIAAIFVVGEWARGHFGYTPTPFSDPFSFQSTVNYIAHPNIKQWLINGDFPMLPWTGVMLFGGLIGQLYVASKETHYFQSKFFIGLMVCVTLSGLLLVGFYQRSEFLVVHGYAEIFYPPSVGIVLCLSSLTLILLTLSNYIQHMQFLGELGRSSLAIYAFHLLLIQIAAATLGKVASLPAYCMLFACILMLVYGFSHLLVKFKNNHPRLPKLVAWLIGT